MRRLLPVLLTLVAAATAAAATPKPPSAEAVVRAWSAALDAGDDAAAGRLFDRRAYWVQGGYTLHLRSRADAALLTGTLPCSGKIVALTVKGDTAVATFLLGDRPGRPKCTTPGQKAAALFVVRRGQIVLWQQVPVPAPPRPSQSASSA